MALFVEHGHTAAEALRAATLNAAKYRAVDDSGVVERDKRADLVLVDANPLADVRNTAKIHAVVLNGRLLDREKLDQLLAEGEAAARRQEAPPPVPTVVFVITAPENTAFAGSWESDFEGAIKVDLKINGSNLTGTINGGRGATSQVLDGQVDGNTMTFKVKSPAADRTITFTATRSGDEINFTRDVEVAAGGSLGDQGLFGARGAQKFSARRVN